MILGYQRVLKGKCPDDPDGKPQVRGAPGCYIHPPTIELAVVGYKSLNLNLVP